jgi:photosystem II stability/assembly factor-like uncharacterized protein
MKDYYAILEIPPDASPKLIREQYHFLVHAWHPDKFPNPDQKARVHERIKEINEAYQVLKNPDKRAEYDRKRLSWASAENYTRDGQAHGRSQYNQEPNSSYEQRSTQEKSNPANKHNQTEVPSTTPQSSTGKPSRYRIGLAFGTAILLCIFSIVILATRWTAQIGQPLTATEVPETMLPMTFPAPSATATSAPGWESSGLMGEYVSRIAVGVDGVLYAGTFENHHGVFKSVDNGVHWEAINNGLPDLSIRNLFASNIDSNVVYAWTQDAGTWQTQNGGKSWVQCGRCSLSDRNSPCPIGAMTVDSSDRIYMFLTSFSWTLYASNRCGDWEELSTGNFVRLVASKSDQTLYGIDEYGRVRKSTDGGRSWWTAAGVGADYTVNCLVIDPHNSNIVFVGTDGMGLYRSVDGGGSWTPINNTLPQQGHELVCLSLFIDPVYSSTIYAAFRDFGVYQTTDSGESWNEITANLNDDIKRRVFTISIQPGSPRALLIGTSGQGIWRLLLEER